MPDAGCTWLPQPSEQSLGHQPQHTPSTGTPRQPTHVQQPIRLGDLLGCGADLVGREVATDQRQRVLQGKAAGWTAGRVRWGQRNAPCLHASRCTCSTASSAGMAADVSAYATRATQSLKPHHLLLLVVLLAQLPKLPEAAPQRLQLCCRRSIVGGPHGCIKRAVALLQAAGAAEASSQAASWLPLHCVPQHSVPSNTPAHPLH